MNTVPSFVAVAKRILMACVVAASLPGCEENSLTPAEQDVATFAQQLQGNWTLDKVSLTETSNNVVMITPVREFACEKLSTTFQAKDVVNKYTISYSDKVVHVKKLYTCRLAPEELSWQIERIEDSDLNINWMTGKNFSIKEVNEATVNAEFKLAFFNLENCAPNGQPVTAATKNKLTLEVIFDTKEKDSFKLEFSKTD